MSLTVRLALVFHIFVAVAVMVMVCGRRGCGPLNVCSATASCWHVNIASVTLRIAVAVQWLVAGV